MTKKDQFGFPVWPDYANYAMIHNRFDPYMSPGSTYPIARLKDFKKEPWREWARDAPSKRRLVEENKRLRAYENLEPQELWRRGRLLQAFYEMKRARDQQAVSELRSEMRSRLMAQGYSALQAEDQIRQWMLEAKRENALKFS